jgi:DNA-binding response OmpR family regulator
MPDKILIVDDERNICEILEFNLANEGYQVECAYSAEEGLKKLSPHHTIILLDVMMGGMSGYKMAEKLRKANNQTPIIFLTAKDTENDMLTGFSVGADDYISKPFSIKEVIARVKAIVKRAKTTEKEFQAGDQKQFVFKNMFQQ